jgi:hypothetical protein
MEISHREKDLMSKWGILGIWGISLAKNYLMESTCY